MKNISKNLKYSLVVIILFLSQLAQAQPGFDDGDDVQDVPIDKWVLPLMLIVIIFMFVYFYNKHKRAVQ